MRRLFADTHCTLNFAPIVMLNLSRELKDPRLPFLGCMSDSVADELLTADTGRALEIMCRQMTVCRLMPTAHFGEQPARSLRTVFPWLASCHSGNMVCPGPLNLVTLPKITGSKNELGDLASSSDFLSATSLHPSDLSCYPFAIDTCYRTQPQSSSFDCAVCGIDSTKLEEYKNAPPKKKAEMFKEHGLLFQIQAKDGKQLVTFKMLSSEAGKCGNVGIKTSRCVVCMGGVHSQVLNCPAAEKLVDPESKQLFALRFRPASKEVSKVSNRKRIRSTPSQELDPLPSNLDIVVLLPEGVRALLGEENYQLMVEQRKSE